MKKGFTLIELLIVMAILGVLVTVALPKYRVTLERGRSMEALANLKAASDMVNAQYVMNDNAYSQTGVVDSNGHFLRGDFANVRYFSDMSWPSSGFSASTATISLTRDNNLYTLEAVNVNGELKYITCTGNATLCQNIGMEDSGSGYKMDFR